jgi:putative ABC transport system ATP-binding protein
LLAFFVHFHSLSSAFTRFKFDLMLSIIVDHLTKQVQDSGNAELTILDDICFTVEEGQSVAIVGASGSGKSTLLGLLAGLDLPSSGSVTLLGQALYSLNEDERAQWRGRNLGFVFQSYQLLPQMSAIENVMLPLELRGDKGAMQRAKLLLEQVGLQARLHHYPKTLSGGEQQRVALARAFAPNPKLLLADEPTGSLDAATGERIIELLFELNAKNKTTLILVTHDEQLAKRCDQQIRLSAGRLVT